MIHWKKSSKQTIGTKALRFGYKNFVLISDYGYHYFLDPYCKAKYGGGKLSKNLCAGSVLDCITEISDWSEKEVYFDKRTSSILPLQVLKTESIPANGTIRADLLGKELLK